MADIEKVIKAIECCVVNHTRCFDDNDKLCPYFSTKVYMCEIELLKDALALLKEQEAMNVDAFVQWCIDSHIMGDAIVRGIKYWVGKYKETKEGQRSENE